MWSFPTRRHLKSVSRHLTFRVSEFECQPALQHGYSLPAPVKHPCSGPTPFMEEFRGAAAHLGVRSHIVAFGPRGETSKTKTKRSAAPGSES